MRHVWNANEEFASLGIGISSGFLPQMVPVEASFPGPARIMRKKNVHVPAWMDHGPQIPDKPVDKDGAEFRKNSNHRRSKS